MKYLKLINNKLLLLSILITPLMINAKEKADNAKNDTQGKLAEITEISINKFWSIVKNVWESEIFSVGGRQIRISNIVIALLFLILGIIVSRIAGKIVKRILIKRLNLSEHPAHSRGGFDRH